MSYSVCLDAGHGGYDPGACGNGLHEADITLDIVLKLKALLISNGINVILTRDGDHAPNNLENNLNGELQARCDIANSAKVNLFLSIHINSAESTQANGGEVLIQGSGGNAEKFANILLNEIINATGFYNRGIKVQNVMVLRNTNMPAVLSESGFISNIDNAKNLADSNFRQQLAIAHCKGICEYFGVAYKEQSNNSVSTIKSITTNNNQGGIKKVKNLVIYLYPEDEGCAMNLARHLQCPCSFYPKQFTSDLFDSVENIIQVGGSAVNPKVKLITGNEFDDTMVSYLKYIGKIK